MTLQRRKVEDSLKKKGFLKDASGRHVRFLYVRLNGAKTDIFTVTSHGRTGKDIGDNLVSRMAKQCRVNRAMFEGLVRCTVGQEEYEDELIRLGAIPGGTQNT